MEQFLLHAEKRLKATGGNIEGDQNNGIILVDTPIGAVSGNYVTVDDLIHFKITKKPLLLSCTNIRALVADALGVKVTDLP